ncbi:MAG: hypothetical protein ACHQ9S_04720 [Candidatus Binatia bacterium]
MHHRTNVMTVALLSGLLTVAAAAGCAAHKTSTVRTVTVEESAPAKDTDEAAEPRGSQKTVTTTTTTQSDEGSPGIIGSTFRLAWAVISFPFRVIGALF